MSGMEQGPGTDSSSAEDDARVLGRLFEDAREAAGLSIEDAAKRLYLTAPLIRNIEAGAFDDLPKPAYLRGYLRSYARLVALSGDEVVARYDAIGSEETGQPVNLLPVTEEEVGSAKLTGPVATTGLWGLAGIVVILVLVWGLSGEEESAVQPAVRGAVPQPDEMAAMAEEWRPEQETMTDEMATAAENGADRLAVAAPAAGAGSEDDASMATVYTGDQVAIQIDEEEDEWRALDEEPLLVDEPVAGAIPAQDPDRPVAAVGQQSRETNLVASPVVGTGVAVVRRIEDDAVYVTVQAGGEDHLSFNFTGDCWIEVSDSLGMLLYEDLHHAGDVVDLFGPAPFRVLVGRAQAVAIRFNGDPVELIPNIVNNTAKVELGS